LITPATTADWLMATGLFAILIAFGVTGFRWMLREDERESLHFG
jgi:hypothetical protein